MAFVDKVYVICKKSVVNVREERHGTHVVFLTWKLRRNQGDAS